MYTEDLTDNCRNCVLNERTGVRLVLGKMMSYFDMSVVGCGAMITPFGIIHVCTLETKSPVSPS